MSDGERPTNERYILRDARVRQNAADFVASLPVSDDKPLQVVIAPYRKRRSLAQNRCFHALCKELSDQFAEFYGQWHSPAVWKQLVKQELLGEEAHEIEGRVVSVTRHTSSLTTREFAQLLERMPPWALDCFELELSLPDDWTEATQ